MTTRDSIARPAPRRLNPRIGIRSRRPAHMATGDVGTHVGSSDDGSLVPEPDPVSADSGSRTPFDRRDERGCEARRRTETPAAPRWDRHPAAVRVVPRDARVDTVGREASILPELLVGQIEQRSLGHQHRPALNRRCPRGQTLQGAGAAFDPQHVDGAQRAGFPKPLLFFRGGIQDVADPFAFGETTSDSNCGTGRPPSVTRRDQRRLQRRTAPRRSTRNGPCREQAGVDR